MANNYNLKGLTGKSSRKMRKHVASALTAPHVARAQVIKKDDAINDATRSGKQEGAMILTESTVSTKWVPLFAVGSKEDAAWKTVADANAINVIPAA